MNPLQRVRRLVESPDGALSAAGRYPNRCYTKSVNTIQNSQKGEHVIIMGRVTYRTTSQAGHDPNEVALLMDVTGKCSGCMKHVTARLVAYYSGEILVRCGSCQQTTVQVDAEYWTAAKIFPPWQDDSTDAQPDPGSVRYTPGMR